MAVEVLASARTALETTRGTTVATATRILYFDKATHTQDVATIEPVDSRGGYQRLYRAYPGLEVNSFELEGDLTYEAATLLGQLAVGSVTAGTITAGTAFSWTFVPIGTADTNRSVTMEYSYSDLLATVGWRIPGLVIDEWTLTFEKDKPVTYKAKMLTAGTATTITAFTGSLTDRTEVTAIGPAWLSYIDTTTVGSTGDTRVQKAEFTVKNNYKVRYGADGNRSGIELVKAGVREAQLKISRYFNDTTEYTAYMNKSTRLLRQQVTGGSVGSGTALYTARLDFAGVPTDHKVASDGGLIYAELTYDGIYSANVAGGSACFLFYLANNISSIT